MTVSIVFAFTRSRLRIARRSIRHCFALSCDKNIRNRRVSIIHPRTVFVSSGAPSPFSFRIHAGSSRGNGSVGEFGLNMANTANGAACIPFANHSFVPSMMVIISSI